MMETTLISPGMSLSVCLSSA